MSELERADQDSPDIRNLYRFLDWIMILPEELEAEFWTDLKAFEEERKMAYVTSGARIEYKQGKHDERRSLVLLLLEQKVGQIPQEQSDRISALTLEQLEVLAIALLNFSAVSDLDDWLAAH